jgi:hypothetical protein
MHAVEWTRDARDRQRHILDAAHVLARIIEVEHPFRKPDLAPARFFDVQKLHGEVIPGREMLRQLVFPDVFVQIRFLHVAEGKIQAFAGHEALVEVVPYFFGNEPPRGMAALEVERALRFLGGAIRHLVDRAVERRPFFLQEQVEIRRGELVAQKVQKVGRVLNPSLLAVQLLHSLVSRSLGAQGLQLHLMNLNRQRLHLVEPFHGPALPSGLRRSIDAVAL